MGGEHQNLFEAALVACLGVAVVDTEIGSIWLFSPASHFGYQRVILDISESFRCQRVILDTSETFYQSIQPDITSKIA